ncbi:hypothetical protein DM02DRAFT_647219 [Periconia macrospinosa]|uniref:Uncharacterized protein n=1 Tax=Periconia macrospinosa TaxID=97972 RepID=A0A2V1D281_9PLEO|nr:hypothetical protein DM02DRAFT_647219 [Periconia macrospinosa]
MACRVTSMHRVKWERYARCLYCWAPQTICNKWEETSTQAVAALLAFQQPMCTPWLEQQIQDAAIVHGSDEV